MLPLFSPHWLMRGYPILSWVGGDGQSCFSVEYVLPIFLWLSEKIPNWRHLPGLPDDTFYLISCMEDLRGLALGLLHSLRPSRWSVRNIHLVSLPVPSPHLHLQHKLRQLLPSWANEICTDDSEERAIVLATMNMMNNVIAAWLPLIVWRQVEAPKYNKGFITASCTSFLFVVVVITMALLQKRQVQRWVKISWNITSKEGVVLILRVILGRMKVWRRDLWQKSLSRIRSTGRIMAASKWRLDELLLLWGSWR